MLSELIQSGKTGYAFSMWYKNQYRKNKHLEIWTEGKLLTTEHFYHLGAKEKNRNRAKEKNRNKMIEALIVNKKNLNLFKL